MLSPDYAKRDYLLPPGCKDLIDVIKLEAARRPVATVYLPRMHHKMQLGELPGIPAPLTGEIKITGATTAGQLATFIGQPPAAVIADLMALGIFATVNQVIGFEAIRRVARKYGYEARRA